MCARREMRGRASKFEDRLPQVLLTVPGRALVCVPPQPLATMFARSIAYRTPFRVSRRWAHTTPTLNYRSVTEEDIAHFAKILAPSSVLSTLAPVSTPATELSIYNNDWMNKYHGKSTTVLRPKTTKEVSEIVKWCNERRIAIVPQGGNTGLVGGGVPIIDEVILSLGNMNNIRSFDPVSGQPLTTLLPVTRAKVLFRYYCGGCRMRSRSHVGISCTPQLHHASRPWC